ncbi:hypothetical protein PHYPSEUDO_006093 [Phytophthora pseudosyringae]|uniref:Uncharacterized protein n=1 Tax=Phytophthora pseudosyringae TaxID=221518 RepID=A0A8T1WEB9_9STRA|nr:hypothetical protein PHYPSEUDO_006093 [Phytophthora pseudosyringae]
MTVRSIVEMFEGMAASAGADASAQPLESPGRGNVNGLVTYYDALAVVEETPIILPTKTVRLVRDQPAVSKSELQPKDVEQEEQQQQQEQEQQEEELLEDRQASNQDTSEVPAAPQSSPPRLEQNYSQPMSKIPQPKSREFHLAACSVRKPSSEGASRSRTTSSSNDSRQPLFAPPPTPTSARIRAPCTSYAAFVSRIENSASRLLDFEKDERWLGQVETMKGRVEALKRRNYIALAREVASTPRKSRSLSECSGGSTASTASMSSMDTPEVSCQ